MTNSSTEAPSVGAVVRARRGALGLTQEEAARRAGVHSDTLRDLETGARWPWPKNLEAIARALGLDPAELHQMKAAS